MGIVRWRRRGEPPAPALAVSAEKRAPDIGVAVLSMDQLREKVAQCERCALSESRTQTVFGVGSLDASLMIVGEAPGGEEDARGEPFVGRAGQLLNAMLGAMGLSVMRCISLIF